MAGLYRNPRLVLLEKALRLAQRHVRQSDKPHLQCFFLGSVLVDSGERSPPRSDRSASFLSDINVRVVQVRRESR